jgi:hypothetical protein
VAKIVLIMLGKASKRGWESSKFYSHIVMPKVICCGQNSLFAKIAMGKNCRVKGYHKPELKCTNIAVGKIFYFQNCPWAETAE